jgi:hypothetical protein
MRLTPSGSAARSDESAEALRSVVNAGHRKSATIGRVEMNGQAAKLVRFPVYAPAAIAAIGNLPDTITDRAAVIHMRRRPPDHFVRDYRERITRPEGEELAGELAAWCATITPRIGDPWPQLPDSITDRRADVWEPLIAIADVAGGDWPGLAGQACTALTESAADDTETIGPGSSLTSATSGPGGTEQLEQAELCWPATFRKFRLFRMPGQMTCCNGRMLSATHRGATGPATRSHRASWRSC